MSTSEDSQTVSIREAARIMGVTLGYVYSSVWAGKIRAEKVDGSWRVFKSSLRKDQKKEPLDDHS